MTGHAPEPRGAAGLPLRLGVIGDPVAHSLSPAIQQPALDAIGLPARYELWPTPAAALPARIASLRAPGVLGANVTVPHKVAVMAFLDEVTPLARRAGAVNTIVHRVGRLTGDNTDVAGFAAALQTVWPGPGHGSALILGAGGAARAVAIALSGLGVGPITIANRHRERAEGLAAGLAPLPLRSVASDPDTLAAELPCAGLLVNATSLGWAPDESPLPLDLIQALPAGAVVVDLTYRPTLLLAAARQRGLATLDGLPMLVHQAARALELWSGQPAPLAIMHEAARQAQAARR